ncbi:hypothetical protein DITRI_Ditri08aG0097400 [Diplodiscus trichospermus]
MMFLCIMKKLIPSGGQGQIAEFGKSNDVPVYNEEIDSIGRPGSKSNHAVSGLKFRILREFLQLAYSVLLSCVDIFYFQYLHRDSDVESMTDGHDNMTAYGCEDILMNLQWYIWARNAHTMRVWVYNSGSSISDQQTHPLSFWIVWPVALLVSPSHGTRQFSMRSSSSLYIV